MELASFAASFFSLLNIKIAFKHPKLWKLVKVARGVFVLGYTLWICICSNGACKPDADLIHVHRLLSSPSSRRLFSAWTVSQCTLINPPALTRHLAAFSFWQDVWHRGRTIHLPDERRGGDLSEGSLCSSDHSRTTRPLVAEREKLSGMLTGSTCHHPVLSIPDMKSRGHLSKREFRFWFYTS